MEKIKSFLSKYFGITFLARFLYTIFWLLTLLFIFLAYQRISSINFSYLSNFDRTYLEQTLFDEFSRPFAIGAAALAFLTLGLTASRTARMDKQLIEMQTHREASYQPDLVLKVDKIFHYLVQGQSGQYIYKQSGDRNKQIKHKLDILNIGKGVAKDIKIHFEYDFDEIILILQKIGINEYFEIKNDDINFTLSSSKLNISGYKIENFDENFLLTKEDYILSADIDNSSKSINSPIIIGLLHFINIFLLGDFKRKYNDDLNLLEIKILSQFRSPTLTMSYLDIGNKPFIKNFIIDYVLPDEIPIPLDNNNRIIPFNTYSTIEIKEIK